MKMSRGWHEEWIYGQSAAGERRLRFANARLVAITDEPPVDEVSQLTLQYPALQQSLAEGGR